MARGLEQFQKKPAIANEAAAKGRPDDELRQERNPVVRPKMRQTLGMQARFLFPAAVKPL
jgi:hypothetical protein